MKKRALLVGIDHYDRLTDLTSCGNDVRAMEELLATNFDGTPNYACESAHDVTGSGVRLTRATLRGLLRDLFASPNPVVLYFSGHGVLTETGAVLCSVDGSEDDWGVPMSELLEFANQSQAPDVLIILDCCHSGAIGDAALFASGSKNTFAQYLRDNVNIMAASRAPEAAVEDVNGHGIFTAALLDALKGGAAEHMGWITAPAMYAYAERRFSGLEQQPVYKSHMTRVAVIRQCAPLIDRAKLSMLVSLFGSAASEYPLDPDYEPEVDDKGTTVGPIDAKKVEIALLLKAFRDAGLVTAVEPGEQFFWTAKRSHSLRLTARGQEYWTLVKERRI
jgi:hypothetical protein